MIVSEDRCERLEILSGLHTDVPGGWITFRSPFGEKLVEIAFHGDSLTSLAGLFSRAAFQANRLIEARRLETICPVCFHTSCGHAENPNNKPPETIVVDGQTLHQVQ